ncbi:MAG TPA: hypothetical protein VJK30_04090 [Coxiellaceae bacterium]|nr:MAG: hypothetical protein A3E81_06670 [Gammaproteobacteria bacterium RIFCSPHIGHO2_12_FULL_36_30]HLB56489.1 hypothetical protein [Coxiellaceae bacterium]
MRRRKRHPNKEIETAIVFAESRGWRYQKTGKSAHAWCRLLCVLRDREGCALSVWSTPRNPEMHAKQIIRCVKHCPHYFLRTH